MAGNNANDLNLGVDSSSVVEAYHQMRSAFDALVKGEVDGVNKMNAAMDAFVQKITVSSDRARNAFERSQRSMVSSWEQRAAQVGQSFEQRTRLAAEKNIRDLKLQGDAADRVRKAMQQLIDVENKR